MPITHCPRCTGAMYSQHCANPECYWAQCANKECSIVFDRKTGDSYERYGSG